MTATTMEDADGTTQLPLSVVLRRSTKDVHTEAEHSAFVTYARTVVERSLQRRVVC